MSEPFAITHFCDDIRAELGGKFSYMGIYSTDLIFNGPAPGVLPKLCFAIHIDVPSEDQFKRLEVKVIKAAPDADEGEELVELAADLPDRPTIIPDTFTKMAFHLTVAGFQCEQPADVLVRVYLDGRVLKAGRLAVKFSEAGSRVT